MKEDTLNIKSCERIAVMGGTFDPIHYGHLVTAEAVRNEFDIEKVLFVPTGRPPHKKSKKVSHDEHRYLMTVLATVTNPCFEASRLEIEREGYTYTVDTVRELRKICKKNAKIFFITGADAVHEILTWKDAAELLVMCEFVAVTRPGYNRTELFNKISDLKNKYESRIHFLEVPSLAISSSDIRARVTEGLPIKYLLPEAVEEYIYKNKLYREVAHSFNDIKAAVKGMLSEERYAHTIGVIEEAGKLAKYYHANIKKAELAALLHDCAKDFSDDEKRKLCKEYKIKLDDVLKKQIDLTHQFLAPEIAKRNFGVTDAEVLDAIKYHTTGRSHMSLLEKIIYIADCIEPYRKDYEGLSEIKELAYKDLDLAVKTSLEHTIAYNTKKNRVLHPLSLQALEYLKKGEK